MEMNFSSEDLDWVSTYIPAWKRAVKRLLDIILSVLALVFFSWILILAALLVKLTSRGPIFFVQERVGYFGRVFNIYKFRTMVENAVNLAGYETSENDFRITSLGAFLRRWSLDELPQLWNVLRGEMSLVGPRPTLAYQVEKYLPRQKRRLLVNPGVTGWAQIHGRNELPWSEKIELDLEYIEQFSLWLDIEILLKTVYAVFSGRGIY